MWSTSRRPCPPLWDRAGHARPGHRALPSPSPILCVSGLSRTTAWMAYRPGSSSSSGPGKPSDRESIRNGSPGFQFFDVHGEKRLRPKPVGPETRLDTRTVRPEEHINPPLDRLAPQRGGMSDLEGQLLGRGTVLFPLDGSVGRGLSEGGDGGRTGDRPRSPPRRASSDRPRR